jgi:hypothetical protein
MSLPELLAAQVPSSLVHPELAQRIIWGALVGIGGMIITLVGAAIKRAVEAVLGFFTTLGSDIAGVKKDLSSLTQEFRGVDGTNGLRGDVKGLKRGFARHDRELEVVCNRMHIERAEDPE